MLDLIVNVSYFLILSGMLLTCYKAIQRKEYKKIVYFFIIPFYIFYYILKLPEENPATDLANRNVERNIKNGKGRDKAKDKAKEYSFNLLSKEILAILTIGVFWLFFFVSILRIVFTPPV